MISIVSDPLGKSETSTPCMHGQEIAGAAQVTAPCPAGPGSNTCARSGDGFTGAQASDLFAIANQCPMVGGNAVFKARSLYSLIDDTYEFDDQLLCLPHGIIVKSLTEQQANAITVIPNPAMNEATLILSEPLGSTGQLVLYDLLGAEVARFTLPSEVLRFDFQTNRLAAAVYHFHVTDDTGSIGRGKLSVVR